MGAADRATVGRAVCLVLVFAAAVARPVRAQTTDANRSLAETLFQDARRLMTEKKYTEACPKLAESQRLDPATGTLLNLGVCHSEQGKFASAWVEFNDALAGARRDGRPDREQFARERLTAIEPHISHLTIVVPEEARLPGLQVKLDGNIIGAAGWGVAAPVDPGAHQVTASAPGRLAWTKGLELAGDAQSQTVEIPILGVQSPLVLANPASTAAVPVAASAPSVAAASAGADARPEAAGPRTRLRTASYIVGGAGLAAVGVGAFYGARAFSKWSDRNKNCPSSGCNTYAVEDADQAGTAAVVADVAIGVGLAAVATGALLWYWSRPADGAGGSAPASAISLAPAVAGHGGALFVDGRW
jgi:hypothetical protein